MLFDIFLCSFFLCSFVPSSFIPPSSICLQSATSEFRGCFCVKRTKCSTPQVEAVEAVDWMGVRGDVAVDACRVCMRGSVIPEYTKEFMHAPAPAYIPM